MYAMKQFEIKNIFDGTKIVIPFYQKSMLCRHYLEQKPLPSLFHYLKFNNLRLIIISLQLIIHFLNHLVKNLI